MRVLIVGAGGVGSALANLLAHRGFVSQGLVADLSLEKAKKASDRAGSRWSSVSVDASNPTDVARCATDFSADILINACDPRLVPQIFSAALIANTKYLDMAMSLSVPDKNEPYRRCGTKLGDLQFADNDRWEARENLALVGMGVEPGISNVFAKYAYDELFSEITEVGVRDGSDLVVSDSNFAPTFNIWTVIEECLNPPVIYEADKGFFTTEPFSEPETFYFPEGLGRITCVNVEHEEVLLIPRAVDAGRVTFKYGLGEEFISVLNVLHKIGLDSTSPVTLRGAEISPRDLLAAVLPDPATLGERMQGRTCAGTWVKGVGKDGKPREVYLYHIADNNETMTKYGDQAVVWQTALGAAVAVELIHSKEWAGVGVLGPEFFNPKPFLHLLSELGAPAHLRDERPKLLIP
ncbi:MAG: saccharopine dehydrogenase C-terminal domain-containing protein [Candidatus Paceibacterota bacterium]